LELAEMTRLFKIATVLAGYFAAFLAAYIAFYLRMLQTQSYPDQGMAAFGNTLFFLSVFGVMSLFPTGLIFYFLRHLRTFWIILSIAALAFAVTGPMAAYLEALLAHQPVSQPDWAIVAIFALLRIAVAPLLASVCFIAAFIAPARSFRWALLSAGAIESAVGIYVFIRRLPLIGPFW
jgi:hypothetical protein